MREKIEEKYSRSYSSGKLNHEINQIRACYEMTPHRSRRGEKEIYGKEKRIGHGMHGIWK
jgi:hypothetical protein